MIRIFGFFFFFLHSLLRTLASYASSLAISRSSDLKGPSSQTSFQPAPHFSGPSNSSSPPNGSNPPPLFFQSNDAPLPTAIAAVTPTGVLTCGGEALSPEDLGWKAKAFASGLRERPWRGRSSGIHVGEGLEVVEKSSQGEEEAEARLFGVRGEVGAVEVEVMGERE